MFSIRIRHIIAVCSVIIIVCSVSLLTHKPSAISFTASSSHTVASQTKAAVQPAGSKSPAPVTKATTATTSMNTGCTTVVLPYGITNEDAAWLPAGQTQTIPGVNGSRYSCPGKVPITLSPSNEIIYKGTYAAPVVTTPPVIIAPTETYTPPSGGHTVSECSVIPQPSSAYEECVATATGP